MSHCALTNHSRSTPHVLTSTFTSNHEGLTTTTEKDGNDNNHTVRVQDCSPWNTKASGNGHSYSLPPRQCGLLHQAHDQGHVSGQNDKVPARRCGGAAARGWRLDKALLPCALCVSWRFAVATNVSRVVDARTFVAHTCVDSDGNPVLVRLLYTPVKVRLPSRSEWERPPVLCLARRRGRFEPQ